MRYILFFIFLSGCVGVVDIPPETGKRHFDYKLTRQSIHEMDGGLEPVPGLGIVVGSRIEHHFSQKIYDFDQGQVVVIGYLDKAESETKKVVPFTILKNTYNYVVVSYISYYGGHTKDKLYKTYGCYYLKNPMGFKEYYCRK